ncbi:MAG: RimK family protein [Alphaproteobacteria bacterium]
MNQPDDQKPYKFVIVTDRTKLLDKSISDLQVIMTPQDFIAQKNIEKRVNKDTKVINLSGRYDYLSKGYYVSLLAEARGAQCIPNVSNIIALNWKKNYEFSFPELNTLLEKCYDEPFSEPLIRTYTAFFGRHTDPKIEPVARRLFDLFRFPIISFEIKFTQAGKWAISKIDTPSFNSLLDQQISLFKQTLGKFTGTAWRMTSDNKKQERFWIAILHDPQSKDSPSNKAALQKLITVGKKMGLWVELITKHDFSTMLEFDALFIRETTAINNHTYRFAKKAEQEGIPCIDDTKSIIRCCNKVYLHELLVKHKVPVPRTIVLERKSSDESLKNIEFPAVLKIPDGSFSHGMYKIQTFEELVEKSALLFKKSEIILCQEFVPSVFDWRIGVLNNEAIFASKYYMAQGHWQIYNHGAKKKKLQSGEDESVPLEDVPKNVIKTALAATKHIGRGLYGVDLKQLEDGRIVVIEVNDNPNIDAGVEDKILGDELYRKILKHLVYMIED